MMSKTNRKQESSSFRDPSGFIFTEDGILYRQINKIGLDDYFTLMESGLYQDLIQADLIISHEEITKYQSDSPPDHLIIKPEKVDFISYPYEWSFSQIKHAALLTLEIQKRALQRGMSLKDCSAYNIQFHNGKPVLVDTLSFERYRAGEPWTAYRQFCQHFLCPLALSAYNDVRLNQLLRTNIDGIPLDLASGLLPRKTNLNFSLYIHIHLHARSQKKYSDQGIERNQKRREIQTHQLLGLVESLERSVKKLSWRASQTDWVDYVEFHNYSPVASQDKQDIVTEYLTKLNPQIVWGLGANTGVFSRIASDQGSNTIAFDVDPGAVELNYLQTVKDDDTNLLPLIMDLTNPSPGLGWAHQERQSLVERGPADVVLALALIHHLAIGNNVPLEYIAALLSSICRWLIIEFVPKDDPQVQRLLRVREDIFTDYNQNQFTEKFGNYFDIIAHQPIKETDRILYLMEKRRNS
jgi:ribosomal protein L11 methylase PrmA